MNAGVTSLSNVTANGSTNLVIQAGQRFSLIAWMGQDYFGVGPTPGELTGTVSNFVFTPFTEVLPSVISVNVLAPIGPSTVEYCITESSGNELCVSFDVNVTAHQSTTNAIACSDEVQLSVDENCQADISAGLFLKGNDYGCFLTDYSVYIEGFAGDVNNTSLPLAPGTYIVTVENASGNTCWSTLIVEDKLAPAIECDCPVGGTFPVGAVMTSFSGSLETGDSQAFFNAACQNFGGGAPTASIKFYDQYPFTVSADGTYDFAGTTDWGDGHMIVYDQPLGADVCANIVAGDGDSGPGFDPLITGAALTAGVDYYLVFTHWGTAAGGYSIDMSGTGDILNGAAIYAPECLYDACYLTEDLSYLTLPLPEVTENCGYTLSSADFVSDGDVCGSKTLVRTWTATDINGMSASCSQEFLFGALDFTEITPPAPIVELTCGSNTSMAAIAALFDNPLTSDNGNTYITENHEGYPYAYPHYFIGPHAQKIDNSVCNILVSKSDDIINACAVGCNGNTKVLRTWTYIDWCTNAVGTSLQIIKATDNEAPTFQGLENLHLSTNPWGCLAETCLPVPQLHDNCTEDITYTVGSTSGSIIWDADCHDGAGGYVIYGLPLGDHTVTYYAEDCCGNIGEYSINVFVEDHTPPVAVAKQNIVISLTSSATNGDGIAKLYAPKESNNILNKKIIFRQKAN